MIQAIVFVIKTLGSLAVAVFILRLLLQLARANFRNPLAQGILRLTSWLIMPLRRVLPPIGAVDLASVVAVLLVEAAAIILLAAVRGFGVPTVPVLGGATVLGATIGALDIGCIAVFVHALLSLLSPRGDSPLQAPVASLALPLLRPLQRLLPVLGGFDFSPVIVIVLLQALRILLIGEWPLLATLIV